MKLPKLQQLKYLVALYDTGHFGQAAKRCFVSQSTLSTAIQALEEQLDSQLIERDHKTFIFTPLGSELVGKARQILEQSAELVAMSSSQGNQYNGELHMGMIPTIAPFVVSDVVKAFASSYSKLNLFLREDTTEQCLNLLREGKLDVVVMATPYDTKEFVEYKLGYDPFYHVHKPGQADGSIYLMEKEHCLTEHTISACKLINDNQIYPFQASSLHTLLAMVEAHSGRTYLPKLAIQSGLLNHTDLMASLLNEPNTGRDISLIWRKTSGRRSFFVNIAQTLQSILAQKLN